MTRQRISVVGVGAIGGAIAADLADLGRYDIDLCTRTPFDRLVVEHSAGVSHADARIVSSPENASPSDWVLLATKAHQSAAARPWLDRLCGPSTCVAILQNGVDHLERITPLISSPCTLLPVVVQLPAEKKAPGRIEQSHPGMLLVPDDETGRSFASLFEGGRTRVKPRSDYLTQAWWKLVSNAALGGVCALALRENGAVNDPELRGLVLSIMREVVQEGRAEGADLPDDAPERSLDRVLQSAPDHWSSITVDRREGRRLEWEARNQVVGRYGRVHGIDTPLNDAITLLLKAADGAVGNEGS